MSELDEEVISKVLSNEFTTRALLEHLESRGVKISIDSKTLTHEECVEVILKIQSELMRRELCFNASCKKCKGGEPCH